VFQVLLIRPAPSFNRLVPGYPVHLVIAAVVFNPLLQVGRVEFWGPSKLLAGTKATLSRNQGAVVSNDNGMEQSYLSNAGRKASDVTVVTTMAWADSNIRNTNDVPIIGCLHL
jgi:hypothetical protein